MGDPTDVALSDPALAALVAAVVALALGLWLAAMSWWDARRRRREERADQQRWDRDMRGCGER